jgi:hypothetical protein
MNKSAYLDGYLEKVAIVPTTGIVNSVTNAVTKMAEGKERAAPKKPNTYLTKDNKFSGEHEKWFSHPMAQKLLKGSKLEWATKPYAHKEKGLGERTMRAFTPNFMVTSKKAEITKKIKDEAAKGIYTTAKKYYSSDPGARAAIQKYIVNDIKGKVKKYAVPAAVIGGGGLLLWMMMRKKQQQPQPTQQQQQMMNMYRYQSQPMRLGMTGRA